MKINVMGVNINNVTMEEAVNDASKYFEKDTVHTVFTPNPEIILAAQEDPELKKILNESDMLLPDGIGVVIASRILKTPLKERVPGFDFSCEMLKKAKSCYFFGGAEGVAETAAKKMIEKGINVVGWHSGYFDNDEKIIEDINSKCPEFLMVCLGAPKQEKWIYNNKNNLNVKLCIGAGGSLDVLAGNVKRAPVIFQKLYLEWFYRGITQPKRLPRIMKLPGFLFKVILNKNKEA